MGLNFHVCTVSLERSNVLVYLQSNFSNELQSLYSVTTYRFHDELLVDYILDDCFGIFPLGLPNERMFYTNT